MPDRPAFESQIAVAFDRYAGQMPTDVDALELVRATRGVGRSGRPWAPAIARSTARPSPRLIGIVLIAAMALALGAALFVAGALPVPSPQKPAFAPGSIAYEDGGVLYLTDADGRDPVRLVAAEPGEGADPPTVSFAPDRRHIAIMWATSTGGRLVIALPDGHTTGSVTLPDGVGMPWQVMFSWAPDGQRLATYSPDEPGHLGIVGVDGARLGTIALPEGAGGREAYGAAMLPWSPDGRWIAVRDCPGSTCDGNLRYLLVAADGSGTRPLVDASLAASVETSHQSLAWAPDERAALNQWGPGRAEIVSPDGSALQEVLLPSDLNPADASGALAWSPSGDRLAILESTAGRSPYQFVLVDRDLTVQVVARSPLDLVQEFRWAPDGQGFVYEVVAPDSMSLWSLPAAGGTATRLVDGIDGPFDVAGSTH